MSLRNNDTGYRQVRCNSHARRLIITIAGAHAAVLHSTINGKRECSVKDGGIYPRHEPNSPSTCTLSLFLLIGEWGINVLAYVLLSHKMYFCLWVYLPVRFSSRVLLKDLIGHLKRYHSGTRRPTIQ